VDFVRREYIDRDLFLIRVSKQGKQHSKLKGLTEKLPIKIIHESKDCYIVEVSVDRHQEEEVIKELNDIGIKELVRTGRIAMKK
jgi:acetolactate synthase-1/3 small subunit